MAGTWTQADIDKLKAAVASGALTVSYDGPPRRSIVRLKRCSTLRSHRAGVGRSSQT
jgi:hypothetical protein